MTAAGSTTLLRRQLKQMQTSTDIPGISCGLVSDHDIYQWEVMLMISDDVKFYGGESTLSWLVPVAHRLTLC